MIERRNRMRRPGHKGRGSDSAGFSSTGRSGAGGTGMCFGRSVALKIPNPDSLASSDLRRRFVEESRTLARLEHPNLLSILEAGAVGPVCYLVTPFCSGPSLAEWLREQHQPVRCEIAARLARDLARTVGYVHSRGILHRDIKPSNVLLEPIEPATNRARQPVFDFVPKLTDFGLAKLVASPTTQTMTGAVVGTPACMAPEQAEGRQAEVGVASDVYALGAILYEMLTGRPPYCGESVVETLRLVSEGRLTAPGSLRADLPRDLGAICLKCLEFAPARRYRTADELADDLSAFLECRPVKARSCGLWMRLAKWARRRPQAAALAATLAIFTVLGISATGWQWRRAEAHRKTTEETFSIAHGAMQRIHDSLFVENAYDAPEFYSLQKTVLDASMPYYQQLLEMKSSDPELRVDVADVFLRLGHMAHAQDSTAEAMKWYQRAAGAWQRLVEEEPTNREYRYYLGKVQGRIGGLLQKQKDPAAAKQLQQAAAIQEQIIHECPSFHSARWQLSETLCGLVQLHLDQQQIDTARRLANRAIEVFDEIALEERESQPLIQRILAGAYLSCAEAEQAAGELEEATCRCEKAVELSRRVVAQNADMPSSANTLVKSLDRLAWLSAESGDSEECIEHYRAAIEVGKDLVSNYPDFRKYRKELMQEYTKLAAHYRERGLFEETLQVQQEAVHFFEQRGSDTSNVAELQSGLADAHLGSARARAAMKDLPGAVDDAEKAIDLYRQVMQKAGETAEVSGKLAYSLRFLAGVQGTRHNGEQAAQLYRDAIDLQERLVAKHPDQSKYKRDLADYYIAFATQQREERTCEEAMELYQRARETLEQLLQESPAVTEYQLRLIRCNYLSAYNCELLGRPDEASVALDRGKELVLALTPEAQRSLADEKYRIDEALEMAAHARTATGEFDGGIEKQWRRDLLQTSSSLSVEAISSSHSISSE